VSAPPAAAALQVREVVKSYGRVTALDGVSLHVEPGELVVLLGPNGAGKSTLFQLLSGLFTPDAGAILIEGRDMRRESVAALAAIGVVFQQPTLDLELTVIANLRFHARLHGMPAALREQRIEQELVRLGLSEVGKSSCRNLSGGNRRRVELARALLHGPRVLLMDEATVGLDPESRHLLLQHVRELCRSRQLAVLWATHLVDEAADAERVYILDKGKLLKSGTPAQILAELGEQSMLDAFLKLTRRESEEGAR